MQLVHAKYGVGTLIDIKTDKDLINVRFPREDKEFSIKVDSTNNIFRMGLLKVKR